MIDRDIRSLLGGGLLALLGLFTAWYAYGHYSLGTFSRMGPGFLPVILGGVLALLGLIVALPAWWRRGEPLRGDWASAGFVVASIVVFALLLKELGLVIAAIAAALIALVPDQSLGRGTKLKVALAIAAITYLIFIQGLSMNLPAWPRFG
ncbi:tripartite tricarboxylate transporter TctB family protein [Halomonas sp. H5]|uniref:tripartite tricarboxylate transporter TctB family protein n=1 Tax=Halomonas sp. H5 TaxID=3423910 RepID=UPI003D35F1AC